MNGASGGGLVERSTLCPRKGHKQFAPLSARSLTPWRGHDEDFEYLIVKAHGNETIEPRPWFSDAGFDQGNGGAFRRGLSKKEAGSELSIMPPSMKITLSATSRPKPISW